MRVWKLSTGRILHSVEGHTSWVNAVAVTADGRRAVSGSDDRTLRLWDLEDGGEIAIFTAESPIVSCAVARDGRTVVAGDESGRVHFLRIVEADPTKPAIGETRIHLLYREEQSITKPQKPPMRDQVFISYSHKDKEWLGKLQTMLRPMVRNRTISVWEDTKISAGEEWRVEIKDALARARAAVLLVSPYFLESDFIAEHELPPLLDAAKKDGLVILWVYISHCLYDETEIERYQAANELSKPLDSLTPSELNAVLVDVCRKIKAAVNP
jgi:hypothetical protein